MGKSSGSNSKKHGSLTSDAHKGGDNSHDNQVRLANLKRGKFVASNSLAHILKVTSEDGIPKHFSARTQSRARKSLCARSTTFGEIVQDMWLPLKPKGQYVGYQHPLAMLDHSVQECQPLAELMSKCLEAHA